ncbi:MAG: CHAT domain-containing protein [Dokdonella sp.]
MAEVSDSPAGASAREILRWPYGNNPEQVLLVSLENAILKSRGSRSGSIVSAEEKILREFGADVFKSVFRDSGTIADAYSSSLTLLRERPGAGLRLNLRIDPPEMAMLPWEYAFDERSKPDRYLCLKKSSPVVRQLGNAHGLSEVQINGPVRILAMIANPGGGWDWLDTEKERRQMEQILQGPALAASVEFSWTLRATRDELFDAMQKGPWHIFHFIGHGGTDSFIGADGEYHSEGFVVMDDGQGRPMNVNATELAQILSNGNVSLAVLNCCESARGNASSSVGATLVDAGVPMAIAMQFAISNISASRFSDRFYRSLADGLKVEAALTVARNYMRLESDSEWAIPVFFTSAASSSLFSAPPAHVAGIASAAVAAKPEAADAVVQMTRAQEELRRLWGAP